MVMEGIVIENPTMPELGEPTHDTTITNNTDNIESIVDTVISNDGNEPDKSDPDKSDPDLKKQDCKRVLQAKKRLQAFYSSKLNAFNPTPVNRNVTPVKTVIVNQEVYDEKGNKVDTVITIKKPHLKKGQNPDQRAKAVIEEIEELKKEEQIRLHNFNVSVENNISPTKIFNSEEPNHFKRRDVKFRNYRRSDHSPSPELPIGGKSQKKPSYPRNWTEFKNNFFNFSKIRSLNQDERSERNKDDYNDYSHHLLLNAPSQLIEPFKCNTAFGGSREIPFQHVRFTRAIPRISYSCNPKNIKQVYFNRTEILRVIKPDVKQIFLRLVNSDLKTKLKPPKPLTVRQWFPRSWKGSTNNECKLLENSIGLSFLQNYSGEDEEEDEEDDVEFRDDSLAKDMPQEELTRDKVLLEDTTNLEDEAKEISESVLENRSQTPEFKEVSEDKKTGNSFGEDEDADDEFKTKEEKSVTKDKKSFDIDDNQSDNKNLHHQKTADSHERHDLQTKTTEDYPKEAIKELDDIADTEEISSKKKKKKNKVSKKHKCESRKTEDIEKELLEIEEKLRLHKRKMKKKKKKVDKSDDSSDEEAVEKKVKKKKRTKKKKKYSDDGSSSDSDDEGDRKPKRREKGKKKGKDKAKEKKSGKKPSKSLHNVKSKEDKSKRKEKSSDDEDYSESPKKKKKKNKKEKKKATESSKCQADEDSKMKKSSKKKSSKKKRRASNDSDLLTLPKVDDFKLEKSIDREIDLEIVKHRSDPETISYKGKNTKESRDRKCSDLDKSRKSLDENRNTSPDRLIKQVKSKIEVRNVSFEQKFRNRRSRSASLEQKIDDQREYERSRDISVESSERKKYKLKRVEKDKKNLSKVKLINTDSWSSDDFLKHKRDSHKKSDLSETARCEDKLENKEKSSNISKESLKLIDLDPVSPQELEVEAKQSTPNTDEYHSFWESEEDIPASASSDRKKANRSWESDEELFDRFYEKRSEPSPPRLDKLEMPLHIKKIPRHSRNRWDQGSNSLTELKLLEIERETLNAEKRQVEKERLRIMELEKQREREKLQEIARDRYVELDISHKEKDKFKEQRDVRRSVVKATKEVMPEKSKSHTKGRLQESNRQCIIELHRRPVSPIVDLGKVKTERMDDDCCSLDNSLVSISSADIFSEGKPVTPTILENEYEEFMKAVGSDISLDKSDKYYQSTPKSKSSIAITPLASDSPVGTILVKKEKADTATKAVMKETEKVITKKPDASSTLVYSAVTNVKQISPASVVPRTVPENIPLPEQVSSIQFPAPVPSPKISEANVPGDITKTALVVPLILPRVEQNTANTPCDIKEIISVSDKSCDVITSNITSTPTNVISTIVSVVSPSTNIASATASVVSTPTGSTKTEIRTDENDDNTRKRAFNFTSMVLPAKKILLDNSALKLNDDSDNEDLTGKMIKKIDDLTMAIDELKRSTSENKKKESDKNTSKKKAETAKGCSVKKTTDKKSIDKDSVSGKPLKEVETKDIIGEPISVVIGRNERFDSRDEFLEGRIEHQDRKEHPEIRNDHFEIKKEHPGINKELSESRRENLEARRDIFEDRKDYYPEKRLETPRKRSRSRSPHLHSYHDHRTPHERDHRTPRERDHRRSGIRDSSPRKARRSISPHRRNLSPRHKSPKRRRYASPASSDRKRHASPIHRNRSPGRRSMSPHLRNASPKKESREASHKHRERIHSIEHRQREKSPLRSPLQGPKRSVADSTISDDLLPQPNSDDLLELSSNPVKKTYDHPERYASPARMPLDERISQALGIKKEQKLQQQRQQQQQTQQVQQPKQVSSSSNYPDYNAYGQGYYDHYGQYVQYNTYNQQAKPEVPNQTISTPQKKPQVVQVGNFLEVVPSDDMQLPQTAPKTATPKHQRVEQVMKMEPRQRILQVGNMLQIVPRPEEKSSTQQEPKPPVLVSSKPSVPASSKPQVRASAKLPVAASPQLLVAVSPRLPVAASPRLPVAASPRLPVAPSSKPPVAASPKLPVATSSKLPVAASPKQPLVPASPKPQQIITLKPRVTITEPLKPVENIAVDKQTAESVLKKKIADRRAEREKRRAEREIRKKEKEKKKKEKEKQRQIKLKIKGEEIIKRALLMDIEGEDDNLEDDNDPSKWPPVPVIISSYEDGKEPGKSILISSGFSKPNEVIESINKIVKFADGVRPGEGTSPSAGEDLSSPPPPAVLSKDKRYKKIKIPKKSKKKKIKVKVVKKRKREHEEDSDDNLPPPPPPPGSPPPHLFPPRIKTDTVNNIKPSYIPSVLAALARPPPPPPPSSIPNPTTQVMQHVTTMPPPQQSTNVVTSFRPPLPTSLPQNMGLGHNYAIGNPVPGVGPNQIMPQTNQNIMLGHNVSAANTTPVGGTVHMAGLNMSSQAFMGQVHSVPPPSRNDSFSAQSHMINNNSSNNPALPLSVVHSHHQRQNSSHGRSNSGQMRDQGRQFRGSNRDQGPPFRGSNRDQGPPFRGSNRDQGHPLRGSNIHAGNMGNFGRHERRKPPHVRKRHGYNHGDSGRHQRRF